MTNQDIFDKVYTHFIVSKNPPSFWVADKEDYIDYPPSMCKYRDGKGNKCAMGIFIPDDEYNPNMEGVLVVNVVKHEWFGKESNDGYVALLEALQGAHDQSVFSAREIVEKDIEHKHFHPAFVQIMILRLKMIANAYELDIPVYLH